MERSAIRGVPLPVPRLIQGTLHLSQLDVDAGWASLDAAYAAGVNAFDTAVVYGRGAAERVLGDWMQERGIRRSVTVIDKGCHPLAGVPRMNPDELGRDLDCALERLRTDYLDLFLLHRDDPELPVGEIVSALNEAVAAGRILSFGASNWSHQRLQQAADFAARHALLSFAASSPALSLAEPLQLWAGCVSLSPRDREAYQWYRATGLPVLGWSPVAGGFLSGRFTRDNQASFEAPPDRRVLDFYASETNFERLDRLRRLAAAKGLTPAQAALVYVLSQPLNVFAVTGCRTAAELHEATSAASQRFGVEELRWLEGLGGAGPALGVASPRG